MSSDEKAQFLALAKQLGYEVPSIVDQPGAQMALSPDGTTINVTTMTNICITKSMQYPRNKE